MDRLIIISVAAHGVNDLTVLEINDWNNPHRFKTRLKILVFEFICGGGLADQPLPASLLAEGRMMLESLVGDLQAIPGVELLLPLDCRCRDFALPACAEVITITEEASAVSLLRALISRCDAVWPIAPETDGILAAIARMVVAQRKILLASPPEVIALCADKWATYQALTACGIPAADTVRIDSGRRPFDFPLVIKPADGVGCQGGKIVNNTVEYREAMLRLEMDKTYLAQPFYSGRAVSLSCLYKQGRGWLMCCNRQQIEIENGHFVLRACHVNIESPYYEFYRNLTQAVAAAIPDLWGYIGIDLIETSDWGPLVLEINPRLTTSYAGIKSATGINVAEQVLGLLASEPNFPGNRRRTVKVGVI